MAHGPLFSSSNQRFDIIIFFRKFIDFKLDSQVSDVAHGPLFFTTFVQTSFIANDNLKSYVLCNYLFRSPETLWSTTVSITMG